MGAAVTAPFAPRDGAVPGSPTGRRAPCVQGGVAWLGPAGTAVNRRGVIVATDSDGASKWNGGRTVEWGPQACPSAISCRPVTRSFVVLGPPSAMRAELGGLDRVVADAETLRQIMMRISLLYPETE